MEQILLREKLYDIIESGDKDLLESLYAFATDHRANAVNVMEDNPEFTQTELKEFERRREEFLSGKGISYSWDQVKEMITGGREIV